MLDRYWLLMKTNQCYQQLKILRVITLSCKPWDKQLISIRNKSGSKTDPCDTPALIFLQWDDKTLKATLCCLFVESNFRRQNYLSLEDKNIYHFSNYIWVYNELIHATLCWSPLVSLGKHYKLPKMSCFKGVEYSAVQFIHPVVCRLAIYYLLQGTP